MPFLDGKPVIITKRNTDKFGNPISVKQVETKQVADVHNVIPLNYSIDRNHPIVINGLHQIYNEDEVSENTFFADYDQGLLFFHSSRVGQSLTVTYMGTGYILISSTRIYRYNKINSSSANESIEASFEKIENLLNTVVQGGATIPGTTAEVVTARTDGMGGTTYPSLGSRLDAITQQLNNMTSVVKFKNTVNVNTTTNTISVGIAKYEPNTDGLSVYLSGIKMIEGVDYSLNKSAKTITNLKGQWVNGDQLYFEVLQKIVDGTMGGGGGGTGGAGGTTTSASNVILTAPIYGRNNVQNALIEIQTKLDRLSSHEFTYNTYTNIVNVDKETNAVAIGIDKYDSAKDKLAVYLGGVRLLPGVGYSLSQDGKSIICGNGNWMVGDQIFFEMTKREMITSPLITGIVKC